MVLGSVDYLTEARLPKVVQSEESFREHQDPGRGWESILGSLPSDLWDQVV